VNNFVSGLILLAERPIKVGDLVAVGGEEGHVRKISVRSTEVETPERARVIIPNSYFITEKVKNWTLRDNTRRIGIAVTVGYACDPRKVRTMLLQLAHDHPDVMTSPAPSVDLEDFGPDGLHFRLSVYLGDLTKAGSTGTDLRLAILDSFDQAGIAIAGRQSDADAQTPRTLSEAPALVGNGSGNGHGAAYQPREHDAPHRPDAKRQPKTAPA